jgi:PD-(D/E)XK nuclease superfamily
MAFTFDLNNVKWQKGSYGLPEAVYKIKIPSVSTILGEMIPDPEWDEFIAKVGKAKADQIMTSAGNRGSSMHTFLENYITNYSKTKDISEALKYTQEESPKMLQLENMPNDKIEEGRKLFYKFYYSDYANTYSDVLAIELGIYSPSLFYRGKLDILYRDKLFGLSLTDFKSSNGKIKEGSTKELKYKYQLGAYANCLDEMYKEKSLTISRATILCVDKQNDILQEVVCIGKELEEYKDKFKTLVREYHIKNKQEYLIN